MACALALAALAVTGCGSSSHPNEPRPAEPTRVSVTLTNHGVIVQPTRIAFGPEPHQQIPQNQNHPQPPIETKRPLDVVFVAANQTAADTRLFVDGGAEIESEPVLAHSPGTIEAELPTGTYRITAEGIPYSRAKLEVGPYRASSQNDILQP
ncbi:MAG TPA: hypothetical protein VHI77_11430 [Solirubrobacterales bacterium]|nr:hypothetical protein [Solirubrobacterales bacterium]